MESKIVMPRLRLTIKTGTIVQWFKKENEIMQKGHLFVLSNKP